MPAMDRPGLVPDRVTDALLTLKTPVPLPASAPFAVLGLMINPAALPVAVMLAWTLTLFEAVSVSVVLALHVTGSYTFTLPDPTAPPLLLCKVTAVVARLAESVAPVI